MNKFALTSLFIFCLITFEYNLFSSEVKTTYQDQYSGVILKYYAECIFKIFKYDIGRATNMRLVAQKRNADGSIEAEVRFSYPLTKHVLDQKLNLAITVPINIIKHIKHNVS